MSFRFRAWRILLLFAFLAAAATQAFAYDRPFGSQGLIRLPQGRVGLMVFINGKGPFLFCLDTGTSKTVLTPALRQRLGITAMQGAPVNVVTAAGWTLSQYYPVDEVATAGVIVEGEHAVVVDLPGGLGVWGALGGDFLSNFTVDLDLRRQIIKLYPPGSVLNLTGLHRLNGRFDQHGLIVVPASVDGTPSDAVLDTGAETTVINLPLASATKHETVVTMEWTQKLLSDAEQRHMPASTTGLKRIRLGVATWTDRQVMVSNLPGFEELGLNQRPAILFGMDLLAARRIVLDYGSGTLWLEP